LAIVQHILNNRGCGYGWFISNQS